MTALLLSVILILIFMAFFALFRESKKENDKKENSKLQFLKDYYVDGVKRLVGNTKLNLYGVAADGNSDEEFCEVISKIHLPENVKVKIHEEI